MKHEQLRLGDVIDHIKRAARVQGANVNPRDVLLVWKPGDVAEPVHTVQVRAGANGQVCAYLGGSPEDADARELFKACANAAALLDHIQTETGQTYPETLDLQIAVENAEPVHDGKRITGREFVWTSPTVGPLLIQAARAALARLQKIQADDIAETEEYDALPYPEADTLELALVPFDRSRMQPAAERLRAALEHETNRAGDLDKENRTK